MKVVAYIYCEDDLYTGAAKTINSIKYFHPEFKIVHFNTKKINKLKEDSNYRRFCQSHTVDKCNNPVQESLNNELSNLDRSKIHDAWYLTTVACKQTFEEEKPDIFIKFGADTLLLGRIDELLEKEFDAGASMNDSFFIGERDERCNRPDKIRSIRNCYWVNSDFIIIKNKKFLDSWADLTFKYWNGQEICLKDFGKFYKGDDQSALNITAYCNGYKFEVFDLIDLNKCYGASANWSGQTDFKDILPESIKAGGVNSWPSWNDFFVNKNGETIVPDKGFGTGSRIVKLIHQGGGYFPTKLGFDLFNSEYRKHLKKITGFDE